MRGLFYSVITLLVVVASLGFVSLIAATPSGAAPPVNGDLPTNPTHNITPPCSSTWVVAINCAHQTEGVAPLPVGVAAFDALTKVEQIFAITNLERIARGRPPALAMTAPLNASAQTGADGFHDPVPFANTYWSNAIDGTTTPLQSDFAYMYNDGFGSNNIDCQKSSSTTGCWGHRDDILGSATCYTNRAPIYSMGGAVVAPKTDNTVPTGGAALVIVRTCGVVPSTQTATWPQLEATLGIAPAFQASTRIFGETADATAAAELEHQFSTSCPGSTGDRSVVLATDAGYSDALASAYLARALGSGILLTTPGNLSAPTRAALEAEGITHVYVVGGPLAVSTTVVDQVEALPLYGCHSTQVLSGHPTVTRLGGATLYTTSADIAESQPSSAVASMDVSGAYGNYNATQGAESAAPSAQGALPTAIVATGTGFQDAESASALSYAEHLPILLTTPSALSPQASSAISKLGIRQVIVMGGQDAVSDSVAASLEGLGVSVLRIAGVTYSATSTELASFETASAPDGAGWTGTGSVVVARGDFYSDGLAGAVVAADGPSSALPEPLLLTESPVSIGTPIVEFLENAGLTGIGGKQVSALTVLGGPGALTTQLVDAMGDSL